MPHPQHGGVVCHYRLRAWMCWGLPPVRLPLGSAYGGFRLRGSHGQGGLRRPAAFFGCFVFLATFAGLFLPGGPFPLLGFAPAWEPFPGFDDFPEVFCDFAPKHLVHRPTGKC